MERGWDTPRQVVSRLFAGPSQIAAPKRLSADNLRFPEQRHSVPIRLKIIGPFSVLVGQTFFSSLAVAPPFTLMSLDGIFIWWGTDRQSEDISISISISTSGALFTTISLTTYHLAAPNYRHQDALNVTKGPQAHCQEAEWPRPGSA